MKFKLSFGLIISGLIILGILSFISGCNTNAINSSEEGDLTIYTHCEDKVVCYYYRGGYNGGMSCFRDNDLVLKYCNRGNK